jgi:hypothetical protein
MRLAAVAAAVLALAPGRAAAEDLPVDLELVLAVDVSGSMDREEQAVQRAGYSAALRHPDVTRAISSGAYGRIALTYVEWAGAAAQVTVIPWRLIDSPESSAKFADELDSRPIASIRGTSISAALEYVMPMFSGNGYEGLRKVIDVSGDGANNAGAPVVAARDAALAAGLVINGLPIMIHPSMGFVPLDRYYTDCVIGGPSSFVLPVKDVGQLAEAIRRKLVLEVAERTIDIRPIPVQATPVPFYCAFR